MKRTHLSQQKEAKKRQVGLETSPFHRPPKPSVAVVVSYPNVQQVLIFEEEGGPEQGEHQNKVNVGN